MNSLDLEKALQRYTDALTKLEALTATKRKQNDENATEIVLDVLVIRDRIQSLLTQTSQNPKKILLTLSELDQRLKQKADVIVQIAPLAQWRDILNPPKTAWWWFFDTLEYVHAWDRYDWLWGAITMPIVTVNFSLVVAISSRFLSGGVDALGAFAVVGQAVLALTAARGTLTKRGQHTVEKALESLKIPQHFWQEVKLGGTLLVLVSLISLHASLPKFAQYYVEQGKQEQLAGQLINALQNYRRATELDPNNMEAHFRLGSAYENLLDFKKAKSYYQIAMLGGEMSAYSNLGRLYILDKNYSGAAFLLKQGLLQPHDPELGYFLLKNLGWARLKQGRYEEADAYLKEAIDINSDRASAYCLLAQVQEAKGNKKAALPFWEKCRDLVDGLNPDEDRWFDQAQQRLTSISEEATPRADSGNP